MDLQWCREGLVLVDKKGSGMRPRRRRVCDEYNMNEEHIVRMAKRITRKVTFNTTAATKDKRQKRHKSAVIAYIQASR